MARMVSLAGRLRRGIKVADEMKHYHYEVGAFYFSEEGAKTKMKGYNLISFTVVNDYINNLFPIIQIRVSMDAVTYYNIVNAKSTVYVRLLLNKYTRKPGEASSSKLLKSDKAVCMCQKFILIMDDDSNDMSKKMREENRQAIGADVSKISEELGEQANIVEFYLFRSDLIKRSKKRINRIFKKANPTDGIAYIARKMCLDDFLMSPADNETDYEPFIIPPLKATDAIQYIDTFYGLYRSGSMLYFDVDASYLLKYEGACTAYRDGEQTDVTIIIPEAGSEAAQELCQVKRGLNYALIGDYRTIDFENRNTSGDVLHGENIHIVSAAQEKADSSASEINKKIIVNRGPNKYLQSNFQHQKSSTKTVITVEFKDIDINALTPNKRFVFNFEDASLNAKYKGDFILTRCEYMLARAEADMSVVAKCTFMQGWV